MTPMAKYYQPEIETASFEEMKALQSEKLVKQVTKMLNIIAILWMKRV